MKIQSFDGIINSPGFTGEMESTCIGQIGSDFVGQIGSSFCGQMGMTGFDGVIPTGG